MTKTLTHTPWGWTQEIQELAEGVLRVTTAGPWRAEAQPGTVGGASRRSPGHEANLHCTRRKTARNP